MKAPQVLACAAVLSMLVSNVAFAQSEDQETTAETAEPKEELKNGLLFGFSHAFRLIQDRGSATTSKSRHTENLYGFLLGYERVLHRYLALSIIKPFYFNHERVDSPLEIVVSGIYRKNSWEPFLGAGVVSTIARVTEEEGGVEVETVEFSVGLLFIVGFKYFFTPNWAFELEFGYEYVPKSRTTVEHAFADSYQGVYFF